MRARLSKLTTYLDAYWFPAGHPAREPAGNTDMTCAGACPMDALGVHGH